MGKVLTVYPSPQGGDQARWLSIQRCTPVSLLPACPSLSEQLSILTKVIYGCVVLGMAWHWWSPLSLVHVLPDHNHPLKYQSDPQLSILGGAGVCVGGVDMNAFWLLSSSELPPNFAWLDWNFQNSEGTEGVPRRFIPCPQACLPLPDRVCVL